MAGLAIGDALGGPAEGLEPHEIIEKFGRIEGYVSENPMGSDDTEYALLTSMALIEFGREGFTADNIADLWRERVVPQDRTFSGGGFSEMAAIRNLGLGMSPPRSGQHAHAWSDGLAMRVAPIGIVNPGDAAGAAAMAAQDGMVSHESEGIYGGQAIAAAVAAAMGGGDAGAAFDAGLSVIPADSWTAHNMRLAARMVREEKDKQALALRAGAELALHGYYWTDLGPEAVGLAFVAVLDGAGDFRESVLSAVNLGRDADTVAAMAGGIAGAITGLNAVPAEWLPAVAAAPGRCLEVTAGMHPWNTAAELVDQILEGHAHG